MFFGTVIDAVSKDIPESHPLLDAIKLPADGCTGGNSGFYYGGRQMLMGKACDEIIKELSAGFTKLSRQKRVVCFLPLCKAMLDGRYG